MGDILSVFSESIPSSPASSSSSSSSSTASMDPSNSLLSSQPTDTTNHQPHVPDSGAVDPPPATTNQTPQTLENQIEESPAAEKVPDESNQAGDEEDEEEEEGECGFCLFMKGGGCKDTFIEWEKCVEEGENKNEDIVEKCFQATAALKKCMEAHSDYYAPLLQAEKAAEEEAVKQLENEKEKERLNDQEKRGEVEESGDKGKGEATN